MTDVFVALNAVLLEGESLTFKLSRRGDHLVALMLPVLPPAPEKMSPEIEQARAALSLPLRIEMLPAQLDAEFSDRVRGYARARAELRTEHDAIQAEVMDELKEAKKTAQAAVTARRAKRNGTPSLPAPQATTTETAPVEGTRPQPEAAASNSTPACDPQSETQQPLSLF
jgi:PRTRC genetic system protein E